MKDYIPELDDAMSRLRRHFSAKSTHKHCAQISDSHALLMRRLVVCDGLRMNEIAQLLAVKPPAVSAIVDHLEKVKVVERVPDPTDRRATIIRVTPFGLKVWTEIDEKRTTEMRRYLAVLNTDDRKDLLRICNKLLDSFDNPKMEETH